MPALKYFLILLFCVPMTGAYAQVCNGSLGDPVVNINFGSGVGSGSPLPSSVNNYNFVAGDCPNDGSYTIINATGGCFGNTWHVYSQDHTEGDVDGRMMLVNSSLQPNDFYVDTVRNLCPGTTYEFSAWISNVLKPAACNGNGTLPALTFNIETVTGSIIETYQTNNIPSTSSPVWNQFGFFFTTDNANPTIVIRLQNRAPGGCGNDLALDDISFRPCGPTITSTVIGTNTAYAEMCAEAPRAIDLSAQVSSGYSNPTYQWQVKTISTNWTDIPGAVGLNYTASPTLPGEYLYRLSVAQGNNISNLNCRVASNATTILVRQTPTATATSNSPVCAGTTLQLQSSGGTQFSWSGPGGFTSSLQSPSFISTINSDGNYTVLVTDTYGCKNNTETGVVIKPSPFVIINPNVARVCIRDSVQLTASGAFSYTWSPGNGLNNTNTASVFAQPLATTSYTVQGSIPNGCSDTASILVTVQPKPVVNAGPDRFTVAGNPVTLLGTTNTPIADIFWTPADYLNDPEAIRPLSNPVQDVVYVLHAVSSIGCGTATDTVLVKLYNGLFIPNSFSPNSDSKNDTWKIPALLAYPNAKVYIYNRYGSIVYEFREAGDYWDGKIKGLPATPGAYIYLIDLKNNKPVIKGSLLLLR